MREILAWRAVISYRKCSEVSALWVGCTEVPSFYFYLFIFIKQQWSCKCDLKYGVSFRYLAKWFGYLSIYLWLSWWLRWEKICLQCRNLGSIPGQEDTLKKGMAYMYIYTHTHTHTHFFWFFSLIGYYTIFSRIPCTIQ